MKIVDSIKPEKFRYERKFLVAEIDKHELESHIKHNSAMFSEIYYERDVNNIYFDSADLTSYYDNLAGISQRLKVRIRWYGDMFGTINKPVLELKIKNNLLGSKLSFPLKPFKLDNKITTQYLIKNVFNKSDLPAWLIEHLKSLNFALLNRYRRRYFRSADKRYRITLDYDSEFYEIRQKNNTFLRREKNDNYVILELKYDKQYDTDAPKITNQFPFRLTKSSKYVTGVDMFLAQPWV